MSGEVVDHDAVRGRLEHRGQLTGTRGLSGSTAVVGTVVSSLSGPTRVDVVKTLPVTRCEA